MTILAELEQMKTKLEALEREKMKVEGSRDQLLRQLNDMGITSYEEGRVREADLKAQKAAAEEKAAELLAKFREDYAAFL